MAVQDRPKPDKDRGREDEPKDAPDSVAKTAELLAKLLKVPKDEVRRRRG
ncbi:MAG: hypothetical protein WCF24_11440 [Acidimicrobiales bacterium]